MDEEQHSSTDSGSKLTRKRVKRKKGKGIGRQRKKHKSTETEAVISPETSDLLDSSVTDADLDYSHEHSVCGESLLNPHDCYDSDGFSDTTIGSEFMESSTAGETDTTGTEGGSASSASTTGKKRTQRKKLLAYKRKSSSLKPQKSDEAVGLNDSDELVNVLEEHDDFDVSGLSDLDLSGFSSDSTANLTDLAVDTADRPSTGRAGVTFPSAETVVLDTQQTANVTPSEILDSAQSNKSATENVSLLNAGADVSFGSTATVLDSQGTPSTIPEETSAASNQSASESIINYAESCKKLLHNLLLLLPDRWIVDAVDNNIIRLILLNTERNAVVNSNIYWDFESWSLGIFVHDFPVPFENKIFRSVTSPEFGNIGSLADFLRNVADKIVNMKFCSGITEYPEHWKRHKGFIDTSCKAKPCFRNSNCLLIIPENKSLCPNCQADVAKFLRDIKVRQQEKDESKIPDKYLTEEGLIKKKDFYKTRYTSEKRKSERLEKKVERLQVKLDEALRDDLSSILRKNEHLMTPLQLIFWKSQMDALSTHDKRGLRWHPIMVKLALKLHHMSTTTKDFLGEFVIALPCNRTLFDYSHFIEAKEGCQQEIIEDVVTKIKKCGPEDHFSYVNLTFDEMHLRSGLVTNKSTGELIGYTNLSSVEEELKQLQEELKNKTFKPKLAKKVLVYLAQGVTSNVQDIIAVYSTDELSASQLHSRTWDVIYHLEDAGVKVLSLTCDGAAINRKFFKMHPSADPKVNFVYCTTNLASGDGRLLYFIIDPPHLLKTVRNCLANSFRHRKTRKLWKNGEYLTWEVFEVLYDLTKDQKFRSHKLTRAHIKLTSFSCMKVCYAAQIFSNAVVTAIKNLIDNDKMNVFETSQLVRLIVLMNRFFDCVNGKEREGEEPKKADHKAYRNSGDERLAFLEGEFLEFFSDWKVDVLNRPGIFTDSDRARMIISHQSLEALEITVKGFVGSIKHMLDIAKAPAVNGRIFNQDSLEQYFSMIRQKQGDNRNPLLKTVLDTRLSHHAQGQLSVPSKRGNTEVEKRNIDVDASQLRKRQKK